MLGKELELRQRRVRAGVVLVGIHQSPAVRELISAHPFTTSVSEKGLHGVRIETEDGAVLALVLQYDNRRPVLAEEAKDACWRAAACRSRRQTDTRSPPERRARERGGFSPGRRRKRARATLL